MQTRIRWFAKRFLPKRVVDVLRSVLPEFIYYPGYGHTTLNQEKIGKLLTLLGECLENQREGDIIECGVFRGGSLIHIAQKAKEWAPGKRIFGVDTFEGHPYDSAEDLPSDGRVVHRRGLFSSAQIERVRRALEERDLTQVKLCKGTVDEVLPTLAEKEFCFAHLDLDLYQSTKITLVFLRPRMVPGGIIVFDDYGSYDAPGVMKAVDEVLGRDVIIIT